MAETLQAIVPVLGMMLLGMLLRKGSLLSREGIDNIKFLVSRIMLPVAIFHALATADYGMETLYIILIMLAADVLTFLVGFAVRPLVQKKYQKYLPYLVSLYEGGMLAYPLFSNLAGADQLSHIAMVDIAGLLFGFSIYMGMLQQMESGEAVSARALAVSALHSPAFIATVLGVLFGMSGLIKALLTIPAGAVYTSMESIVTAPLNALILLAVGYDLTPDRERLSASLRAILIRVVIQGTAIFAVLSAMTYLIHADSVTKLAALIYMSVPTTFSMQTYIKDDDGSRYVATANSLYCLVTIIVYIAAAVFLV